MSISLKHRVEYLYTPWFQSNGQTADASCCPSFWLSFGSYLLLNGSSTCLFMLYLRYSALIVFFSVVLVVFVLSFLSFYVFSCLLLLILWFLVSKIAACKLPLMLLLFFILQLLLLYSSLSLFFFYSFSLFGVSTSYRSMNRGRILKPSNDPLPSSRRSLYLLCCSTLFAIVFLCDLKYVQSVSVFDFKNVFKCMKRKSSSGRAFCLKKSLSP